MVLRPQSRTFYVPLATCVKKKKSTDFLEYNCIFLTGLNDQLTRVRMCLCVRACVRAHVQECVLQSLLRKKQTLEGINEASCSVNCDCSQESKEKTECLPQPCLKSEAILTGGKLLG